jgi:hypothetical protein
VPSKGFLARNASVTYAVSPKEHLVTAGATVIKHETMNEFLELHSPGRSALAPVFGRD